MIINQGLVDPKVNPSGVADGQLVNIPALRHGFYALTNFSNLGGLVISHLCRETTSDV